MGNRKSSIPQAENEGNLLVEAQAIIVLMERNLKFIMPLEQKVVECQSQIRFLAYLIGKTYMRGLNYEIGMPLDAVIDRATLLRDTVLAFEKKLLQSKNANETLMETMEKFKQWFDAEEIITLKDNDISELKLLLETDERVVAIRSFNGDKFVTEWDDGNFRAQLEQCIRDLSRLYVSRRAAPRIYDDDD